MAFAKQMKRKQICVATSSVGPGAANMVTACGTATAQQHPPAGAAGDVYACRQPDPVLQQVEQTNNLSISTKRRIQGRLPLLGPDRSAPSS